MHAKRASRPGKPTKTTNEYKIYYHFKTENIKKCANFNVNYILIKI